MKKLLALVLSVTMGISMLTGCGGAKPVNSAQGGTTAMIVAIPQGDPFLQICYSGVKKYAEEVGKEPKIIEALDKSEYSEQIRAMAESGANPIFVVWDDLAAEAFKIAPEFKDTKFIVVDSYAQSELSNCMTVVVEPQVVTFISGVLAANVTKSKKVAWVGNMDIPTVNRSRHGYEAGIKYADNGTSVECVYIGDSNDPNKGAELTKQLITNGADVVMQTANQAGLGVIRACQEMKVKAIGFDEWQGGIDENTVFWSALKDSAGATYAAGKSVTENTFKPGMMVYGIEAGAKIYDDRDYDRLTPELKKIVDDLVAKIKSGEIKVPAE